MACDIDDSAYAEFKKTRYEISEKKVSNDVAYTTLRRLWENIDVYCPEADRAVSDARNRVYSYDQLGRQIKASNIYECDDISASNQCVNKYYSDWDWTSKIYPRSSTELMRPSLHLSANMKFRSGFDGFNLTRVYFTYVFQGVEKYLSAELEELDGKYTGGFFPLDEKIIMNDIINNDIFSNYWLVAIYKKANGEGLKIVWYYTNIVR